MKDLVNKLTTNFEHVYVILKADGRKKAVTILTPGGRQVTILQKTINKNGGVLDTWAHQLMTDSRAVILMDGKDANIVKQFRKKHPTLSSRIYQSLDMLLIFENRGSPVQAYSRMYRGGYAGQEMMIAGSGNKNSLSQGVFTGAIVNSSLLD